MAVFAVGSLPVVQSAVASTVQSLHHKLWSTTLGSHCVFEANIINGSLRSETIKWLLWYKLCDLTPEDFLRHRLIHLWSCSVSHVNCAKEWATYASDGVCLCTPIRYNALLIELTVYAKNVYGFNQNSSPHAIYCWGSENQKCLLIRFFSIATRYITAVVKQMKYNKYN